MIELICGQLRAVVGCTLHTLIPTTPFRRRLPLLGLCLGSTVFRPLSLHRASERCRGGHPFSGRCRGKRQTAGLRASLRLSGVQRFLRTRDLGVDL